MDLCQQCDVFGFENAVQVCHNFPSKQQAAFNFMAAVILEPEKIKSVTASIFPPSICHEVMGSDATIFIFLMLGFKTAFSLSSVKRLFSSSSLSAIGVVSSAYLRLLIFLLAILIPACESSSPAFHMMCSE